MGFRFLFFFVREGGVGWGLAFLLCILCVQSKVGWGLALLLCILSHACNRFDCYCVDFHHFLITGASELHRRLVGLRALPGHTAPSLDAAAVNEVEPLIAAELRVIFLLLKSFLFRSESSVKVGWGSSPFFLFFSFFFLQTS